MLDAEAGQRVLEVSHHELWGIVGQQAIGYAMGICPVLEERICHCLGRSGPQGDRLCELSEAISDHRDVFVTGFGLWQAA